MRWALMDGGASRDRGHRPCGCPYPTLVRVKTSKMDLVTSMRTLLVVAALAAGGCAGSQDRAATPASPAEPQSTCPAGTIDAMRGQTVGCLDAAVLGEAEVNACGAELERTGWQPDAAATTAISDGMGKPVRCWREPAP